MEAGEDRRFGRVSVPRGRVQCHSHIFDEISRVGSVVTGYTGSGLQFAWNPSWNSKISPDTGLQSVFLTVGPSRQGGKHSKSKLLPFALFLHRELPEVEGT